MIFTRNVSLSLDSWFKNTFLFFCSVFISCGSSSKEVSHPISKKHPDTLSISKDALKPQISSKSIIVGANQTELYVPLLKNKKVAVVGNQTSVIFKHMGITSANFETERKLPLKLKSYTHLVDSLLARNINIQKVFAPEHGFRGKIDAGELVADGKDIKTGLPVISLYTKNRKPSAAALKDIDIIIFDIQDVGVRFYTYISTLHYVMQACAENNIPVLILDRPNPNSNYIDGPTLKKEHRSFLGVHTVPLVHGLTIGEYANMANEEYWLGENLKCDLTVIPVQNYTHQSTYSLPIRPSPNLPNDIAINLYPSLGFFEGTSINAGRGTEMQFQIFGSPNLPSEKYNFAYTPKPNFGAKHPKHETKICNGKDLRNTKKLNEIRLDWIIEAYKNSNKKDTFFKTKSFTKHAGNTILQQQIIKGMSAEEIKKSWEADLKTFKKIRKKYLLYP